MVVKASGDEWMWMYQRSTHLLESEGAMMLWPREKVKSKIIEQVTLSNTKETQYELFQIT